MAKSIPEKFRKHLDSILRRFQSLQEDQDFLDDQEKNNDKQTIENMLGKLAEETNAIEHLKSLAENHEHLSITAEGDIVLGNKEQNIHFHVHTSTTNTAAGGLKKYKEGLRQKLNSVRLLEAVERKKGVTQKTALGLDTIYIDLKTASVSDKDIRKRGMECHFTENNDEPVMLSEQVAKHTECVILGQPGSGKTSFVNRLLISLLDNKPLKGWENKTTLTPLHIELRRLADWLEKNERKKERKKAGAAQLWEYIEENLKDHTWEGALPWLKEACDNQNLLVVLDGLDEVPLEYTDSVKSIITDFMQHNTANHYIVTCRTLSWSDEIKGRYYWKLEGKWQLLPILYFDTEQIQAFVDIWYGELASRWQLTKGERNKLKSSFLRGIEIDRLKEIRGIPLLLTVMALVHTEHERLPNELAVLYEQAIDYLVRRWDTLSEEDADHRLGKLLKEINVNWEEVLGLLSEIAWQVHGGNLKEKGTADIDAHLLLDKLESLHPEPYGSWAKKLLDGMRLRSGLLAPVGGKKDRFQFPHRSFQEYMAAKYLAGLPVESETSSENFSTVVKRIAGESVEWRYVIQFTGGILASNTVTSSKARDLLRYLVCSEDKVSQRTEQDWRRIWLAGVALLEMGVERIQRQEETLVQQTHRQLIELVEYGALSWMERAEVGDLLCHHALPDTRSGVVVPEWQPVEKGTFSLGDEKTQLKMPHDYWMARYTVTVVQYQAFIEEGGKEPSNWHEQQSYPNRPVTNVSWDAANAWCEWATQQLPSWGFDAQIKAGQDLIVRLPTEAEWEYAARGSDGREYPWGKEWSAEKALLASEHGHAAAVGLFPAGKSPLDCYDMSGNVWEWTRSKRKKYPYIEAKEERNKIDDSNDARVVRGGAFDSLTSVGRCACRNCYLPLNLIRYLGFRVLVSLANSVY